MKDGQSAVRSAAVFAKKNRNHSYIQFAKALETETTALSLSSPPSAANLAPELFTSASLAGNTEFFCSV